MDRKRYSDGTFVCSRKPTVIETQELPKNLHIHQTTGLPIEGRSLVSAGGRSGEGNFICLPAWCLFLRKNLYEHNFMCGCVMKIIF